MLAKHLMQGVGGEDKLYVDDVFSAYTYTGNGATQTINNGIDLVGKGGMTWCKDRGTSSAVLFDTVRGIDSYLMPATTNAAATAVSGFWAPSSTGFVLSNATSNNNATGYNYASWTFRNAFNFFKVLQVTKSAGSSLVIDLSPYMTTPGMIKVKSTGSGSWYVWHRSLPAGQLYIGEATDAATAMGHITVVGTTLTLVNGVIADGYYHIECYAHDTSADGVIQCGSLTTDMGGKATVVTGWEPQYITWNNTNGGVWLIDDTARYCSLTSSAPLYANLNNAESLVTTSYFSNNATGFAATLNGNAKYLYMAIRRPNKPPTTGTQVYNAIARTGTGAAATVSGVGFAPDLTIAKWRGGYFPSWFDRLRGASLILKSSTVVAEASLATAVVSFNMDGVSLGADATGYINSQGVGYIEWFFKRAPGVFDIVCYTGTGAAHNEPHNLNVIPELYIIKRRSAGSSWVVGSETVMGGARSLWVNDPSSVIEDSPYTPTIKASKTYFPITNCVESNGSGHTYVAYLFATKAGVSKVGSFTKVYGSALNVDCGFTTGARFVLVKRLDDWGDWILWDTVRGIVAGNDPYLYLNTADAEVATTDRIDPYAAGFTIPDGGLPAGQYIFLSYA